jgi:hypothetical protein
LAGGGTDETKTKQPFLTNEIAYQITSCKPAEDVGNDKA